MFLNKIRKNKVRLITQLTKLKAEGKSIAGYGAPAKATTLLSYLGIADMINFIVDDAPLKQGKYMPGNHIPIVPSWYLYEKQPDYLLIIVWNFSEAIIKKVKTGGYKGKFIKIFKT